MKEKLFEVLSFLSRQNDWRTASEIAMEVGCSVRSVKSYISELSSSYEGLIAASRKGYLLTDREQASFLLNEKDQQIPQTAEGRKAYIMQRLLIENQTMDLDRLAEELCISPLTLNNEIAKFKKELIRFDLVFHTKNNQIWIDGTEKNKKKMISHMIYENTKDFCCNLDAIQPFFPDFDLRLVRRIVTGSIMEQHFFIDDFSLLNFILHVAITMERCSGNCSEPDCLTDRAWVEAVGGPSHVTLIMDEIFDGIEQQFHVKFGVTEKSDLTLLLMTRLVLDREDESAASLADVVPADILQLMELIQNRVRRTFYLNLNSQDFLLRFALHLKNLMIRLENQINLKNPQLYTIKNTYPFIYDVSVFIADIIRQKTGYYLSEDEIAYITLHIGVQIEEQRALKDKVRILIICPQYYSIKLNLVKKLTASFEDSIIISGVLSGPEEITLCKEYDFILSTIPIPPTFGVPVVQVPFQLRNGDILEIASTIENIKKLRMKRILEQKLKFLFHRELFFYDQPFESENSAIDYMADQLEAHKYVGADFKQKLYEREKFSSSAFANIAMPHPLDMCSHKTAIAVSIHPTALSWGGNKVNLVLMLAINEEDRPLFRDIFDFVTEIICNTKYLQALIATKTYDDFIQLLVSLS